MSLTDALLLDPHPMDIWVALRPDGARGSGTEEDPYDGNTRTDAAMAVSSLTRNGNEATASVTGHGYTDGQVVEISGATGADGAFYNGRFPIYGVTSGTFKYFMRGAPSAPAQGSITSAKARYLFDEVMQMFPATPPPVAIHLGPGIFETRGFAPDAAGTWQPKSGMKLLGSGIGVTMLKLVQASVKDQVFHAIGCAYDNFCDGFEASDFTIDCNLAGQPTLSGQSMGNTFAQLGCGAIKVPGRHIRIQRIRAINFGTQTISDPQLSQECFVIATAGAHPDLEAAGKIPVNCVVEDCIVEQPALNNIRETTCIATQAGEGPADSLYYPGIMAFHQGCAVRNCLVDCEYRENPLAIESITVPVSELSTVTARVPHGLAVDQWIRISGAWVSDAPKDGFDNGYNGSYQVVASSVGGDNRKFTYKPKDPAPTATPAGNMWVGRWSSHLVGISSVTTTTGGIGWIVSIETNTPHYLVPGSRAVINNVTVSTGKTSINGARIVTTVQHRKKFSFEVSLDPGIPTATGGSYLGVSFQGISVDGGSGAVMEGNRIYNCRFGGPYHDTYSSRSLIARRNHYRGVVTGPYQVMGGISAPISIAMLTRGGPGNLTATLITAPRLPHGLAVGQAIRIQNVLVQGVVSSEYNGYFLIASVPSPGALTYRMVAAPPDDADLGSGSLNALWQVGDLQVEDNEIEVIPGPTYNDWGPPVGIASYVSLADDQFGVVARVFRRVIVRGNRIRLVDGLTESHIPAGSFYDYLRAQAIGWIYCEQGIVEKNVVDLPHPHPLQHNVTIRMKYFENTDPGGKLIRGALAQAHPNPAVPQDEVTDQVDDAMSLAML